MSKTGQDPYKVVVLFEAHRFIEAHCRRWVYHNEVSDDEGLVLSRRLAHGKTCVGVDIRASQLSARAPHKGFHELRSLDNVEDEHFRLFYSCVLSGQTRRLVPRNIVHPIVGVLQERTGADIVTTSALTGIRSWYIPRTTSTYSKEQRSTQGRSLLWGTHCTQTFPALAARLRATFRDGHLRRAPRHVFKFASDSNLKSQCARQVRGNPTAFRPRAQTLLRCPCNRPSLRRLRSRLDMFQCFQTASQSLEHLLNGLWI
eukprot:COSAG02_NODE_4199_length_5633_cov_4.504518_4_plen_258_part_00